MTFLDKMVSKNSTHIDQQCSSYLTRLRPLPRWYHRSPWWVTTGAALWCGPWPSIIPRESGEYTHTLKRILCHFLGALCQSKLCFSFVWSAVASLNTPLFPLDPSVSPAKKVKDIPIFDYQIYFQKPVSYSFIYHSVNMRMMLNIQLLSILHLIDSVHADWPDTSFRSSEEERKLVQAVKYFQKKGKV